MRGSADKCFWNAGNGRLSKCFGGELTLPQLRNIRIEELLDRETIQIKSPELVEQMTNAVVLVTGGDGSILPDLKNLADKLGLASKIIFTGNVAHEKVNDYLAVMDIAVMVKSNWYGSPVKIFEYGAASLPMICPDTIPVRDVITDSDLS